MNEVKIGDKVILVAPSGKTRTVIVTDVIRDWNKAPIAIEFKSFEQSVTLPLKFFRPFSN